MEDLYVRNQRRIRAFTLQVRNDLPPDAQIPVIDLETADTQFAAVYIGFSSADLDQNQITDYLTRVVQPKLSAISGVQRADILGNRTFAMRLWLKPQEMAARGVSPSDVRDALAKNNYLSALGATKGSMVSVNLIANTDLRNPDDFRQMVIKQQNGVVVRLGDRDAGCGKDSGEVVVRVPAQGRGRHHKRTRGRVGVLVAHAGDNVDRPTGQHGAAIVQNALDLGDDAKARAAGDVRRHYNVREGGEAVDGSRLFPVHVKPGPGNDAGGQRLIKRVLVDHAAAAEADFDRVGELHGVERRGPGGSRTAGGIDGGDEAGQGARCGRVIWQRLTRLGLAALLDQLEGPVVAVEHDSLVIERADYVVELGPQAGEAGGRIVCQGPPEALADCPLSITGNFLAGRRRVVLAANGC